MHGMERWRENLVRYFADRIRRHHPQLEQPVAEALNWREEHRSSDLHLPLEIGPIIKLFNHLTIGTVYRWDRAELAERANGYRTEADKHLDLEKVIVDIIARERPYLYPFDYGPPVVDLDVSQFGRLVGESPHWNEAMRLVRIAASGEVTTLLLGETGTGKNLAASVIHLAGPRRNGEMIVVPCGALKHEVLANEGFGDPRMLGTDAEGAGFARGWLRRSMNGTLYLDEISDLPLESQSIILRFIEEFEYGYGSEQGLKRPRIIVSSQVPLEKLVAEGKFRRDLYFRLTIFEVILPRLQDRISDIPLLVEWLVGNLAIKHNRSASSISQDAMKLLFEHDWPGNVREMENLLERALLVAGREIGEQHIRFELEKRVKGLASIRSEEVEKVVRMIEKAGIRFSRTLPEEVARFILMQKQRRFRASDIARAFNIAPSTARSYAAKLGKARIITKFGVKKGTVYRSNL